MSRNLAEEQYERPPDNTWNSGIEKSIDGYASCVTLQQRSGIGKEINLIFSKRSQDEIIRTARPKNLSKVASKTVQLNFNPKEHSEISGQVPLPRELKDEQGGNPEANTQNLMLYKMKLGFASPEHVEIGKRAQPENTQKLTPYTMKEGFASPEHVDIVNGAQPEKLEDRQLILPNGIKIKFEHIVALGGDFYGIPKAPIIDPFDEEDVGRCKRFIAAFNTMARAPDDEVEELRMLIAIADKDTDFRKQDEITGGIWIGGVPVKPGRMLKLAMNNHDHFLPHARSAYLIGHQVALGKAREASQANTEDEKTKLLHEAYAMEAFACHFLTDTFASGHIRTPRAELGKATNLHVDGHYLSKCMHDEDGQFGLRVTNVRGDKWIAYGDGMLHKSEDNFKYVVEATQKSVNQVYEAYQDPNKVIDTAEVTDIIPLVDDEEKNNYPLFRVKPDGKLHRRSNINNLQDANTISNWWGPSTATMLSVQYKPKNSAI